MTVTREFLHLYKILDSCHVLVERVSVSAYDCICLRPARAVDIDNNKKVLWVALSILSVTVDIGIFAAFGL